MIENAIGYKANLQLIHNKLIKRITQIYVRPDIKCGIASCTKCQGTLTDEQPIYILDDSIIANCLDIIIAFPTLQNIIFLQTSILKLQKE